MLGEQVGVPVGPQRLPGLVDDHDALAAVRLAERHDGRLAQGARASLPQGRDRGGMERDVATPAVRLRVAGVDVSPGGNFAPVNPAPRTIWGIPVASVAAAPEGLAVVGDLRQAHLWIREDIQVTITETNADDFTKNLFTARAEMRAAFGVQAPLALVKLNGDVELPTEEEESL